MSSLVDFPFEKKEGKFFTPIVSEEADYIVVNGVIQSNGNIIVSGIKGAFAKIKLTLPIANATVKKELFAMNAEAVNSSN